MFFNKNKAITTLLTASLSLFCVANIAFADNKKLAEDCYINKTQGKNVGYTCFTYEQAPNGNYISKKHVEENLTRIGYEIQSKIDVEYLETSQGKPIEANAKVNKQNNISNYKAKINDGVLVFEKQSNLENFSNQVTLENPILFPYSIKKTIINNINKPSITFSAIDFLGGFREITLTYKYLDDDTLPEFNNEKARKYAVTIDIAPTLEIYEWYNTKGTLIKRQNKTFDSQEIYISKTALTQLLIKQYIKADAQIPQDTDFTNIKNINQIFYKIITNKNSPETLFIEDNRQKILQTQNKNVFLKIISEKNAETEKISSKDVKLKKYLGSNQYINPKNASIQKVAKDFCSKTSNKTDLANALEKWVDQNFAKNSQFTEIRPLDAVISSKKANPIEYSMILTSLLRAANIPSVPVIGLEYSDFPSPSFVYTSWVKMYSNGWINLNAFDSSAFFGVDHIALTEAFLTKHEEKIFLIKSLPNEINNFKISVLNYSAPTNTSENKPENIDETINKIAPIKIPENDSTFSDNGLRSINLKKATKNELIKNADNFYMTGNVEDAIKAYSLAIKTVSNNNEFTEILFAKKMATLGLFNLSKSLLLNIYDTETWDNQITSIEKIYYPKIFPSDSNQTLYAKTLYYINVKNEPDTAINEINQHMKGLSDYANYLMAMAYFKKGELNNAENYIKQAIILNDKNLSYKLLYSQILSGLNNNKKSLKILFTLKKEPIFDEEFKNEISAQIYWNEYSLTKKEPQKTILLAEYFIKKQQPQEALKTLDTQNKNDKVYSLKGTIDLKSGDENLAESDFQSANKLNGKNQEALEGLGDIALNQQQYDNAIDFYSKALNHSKEKSFIRTKLAQSYQAKGDTNSAMKEYQKSLKEDNNNYLSYCSLGSLYSDLDKDKLSIQNYKKAVAINPLYPKTWANLAKSEIKRNNYFLAIDFLAPIRALDIQNEDYYYISGLIESYNGNKPKALKLFKQALSINPNYEPAKTEIEKLEQNL